MGGTCLTKRQRLFFGLRLVASALMLGFLLSRASWRSLIPQDEAAAALWVIIGMALLVAAMVLATMRWQRVLAALDHRCALPSLLSHTWAGQFVANFLPSTVGGDILRVSRLASSTGAGPVAFASVVLERLTGFFVLPFITLAALAVEPDLLGLGRASDIALAVSVGTLVMAVAVVFVGAHPALGRHLSNKENWLRFAEAVHLGLGQIRRHPGALVAILATSIGHQLAIVVAAWLGAQALGVELSWLATMAFVPVVAMAQVIPISVNGLGLREGALALLLAPLGVAAGQAVALGLLLYVMNLAVSLLGAPAFAVGSRPLRAATS